MLVITQSELAKNPSKYFNMLPDEKIVIKQKNAFIELTYHEELPAEDDTLMSKEEFFAMVDEARERYKQGHYVELTPELEEELFGDL